MTTTEQVEGQAAQAGDVLPPTQGGNADAAQVENEEAKKKRISDKEWQKNTEAANEGVKIKETLVAAGITDPGQVSKLVDAVQTLQEEGRRKDWEIDHPIVRSEKYKDSWLQVNQDPETKHLSYDKKWKLIRDDADFDRVSKVKEELKVQSQQVSTPMVSKGAVATSAVNPDSLALLRTIYPNLTEKEAEELG